MLSWKNLSITYKEGKTITYPDFEIKEKQHTLIIGKSGTGKSSLIHAIAGLTPVSSGNISFQDIQIDTLAEKQKDKFRIEHIGLVFQQHHLIKSLTAKENILTAILFNKKKENYLEELLEELDISSVANKFPHQLSGGEKQRVSIARALIGSPSLLLADEPSSHLDDDNALAVVNLLQNKAENLGITLVIITHDHRIISEFNHQLILR